MTLPPWSRQAPPAIHLFCGYGPTVFAPATSTDLFIFPSGMHADYRELEAGRGDVVGRACRACMHAWA